MSRIFRITYDKDIREFQKRAALLEKPGINLKAIISLESHYSAPFFIAQKSIPI